MRALLWKRAFSRALLLPFAQHPLSLLRSNFPSSHRREKAVGCVEHALPGPWPGLSLSVWFPFPPYSCLSLTSISVSSYPPFPSFLSCFPAPSLLFPFFFVSIYLPSSISLLPHLALVLFLFYIAVGPATQPVLSRECSSPFSFTKIIND